MSKALRLVVLTVLALSLVSMPALAQSGVTVANSAPVSVVRTSGLLQMCPGITWGAPKMIARPGHAAGRP